MTTPSSASSQWSLKSTTLESATTEQVVKIPDQVKRRQKFSTQPSRPQSSEVIPLTAPEINARYNKQIEKLQEKDQTSTPLSKEVSSVFCCIVVLELDRMCSIGGWRASTLHT